jgi:hypothetical protein
MPTAEMWRRELEMGNMEEGWREEAEKGKSKKGIKCGRNLSRKCWGARKIGIFCHLIHNLAKFLREEKFNWELTQKTESKWKKCQL